MENTKLVEKIKKLLSLGTSPNENEARAALAKAASLASQHGLALNEINQETGEVSDILFEPSLVATNKHTAWEGRLITCIADCFDCKVYVSYGTNKRSDIKYVFVGTKTDTELCNWYFRTIRMKIIRNAKNKCRLVKDQKNYSYGAVISITERLRESYIKVKEEMQSEDTKALVVCKKKSAEMEIERKVGKLKRNRKVINIDNRSSAFSNGISDGKKISIHKEM